jgi:hypothetical protein
LILEVSTRPNARPRFWTDFLSCQYTKTTFFELQTGLNKQRYFACPRKKRYIYAVISLRLCDENHINAPKQVIYDNKERDIAAISSLENAPQS